MPTPTPQLALPYGAGEQTACLPAGWSVHSAVREPPRSSLPTHAIASRVRQLARSRLLPRLAGARRVGIVTVDITRPSPAHFLAPLTECLEDHGLEWQVIVALGRHTPVPEGELRAHLGVTNAIQTSWPPTAPALSFGRTRRATPISLHPSLKQFDSLILVGFVEPTYLAGFSGGPKLLVPGCAAEDTISFNHSLVLLTGPMPAVLDGNEVYSDLRQAAITAAPHAMLLSAALNSRGQIVGLFAGDWQAHDEAVAVCRASLATARDDGFDLVIASPGGAPYDVDMCQAKKALPAATRAVRPGGCVILVAQCPHRWGAVEPDWDCLTPHGYRRLAELASARLAGRVEADWAAVSPAAMFWHARRKARLVLVTDMASEFAHTAFEATPSLQEAIEMAGAGREELSVGIIRDGRRVV